ncbi:MAG: CotH kinase family protein [Bacteroidota bacterium]
MLSQKYPQMLRNQGLIFIFPLLVCLLACEETPSTDSPQPPTPPQEYVVPELIPDGSEKFMNLDSEVIFDQEQLHTFELTLPVSSLAKINSDPSAEEYVEGSLTFDGETISPVGIRYKGSVGAFVNCLSGTDWANPSGFKTCTKLSMKVKINWEGADYKFYGLKKLQFHSQNLDDSQMRERLAYSLFRDMGVPAPRSVHARLIINGVYSGIYALTEQIDGRFTRFNYEEGKGNLYKEIWPLKESGNAYAEQEYINHLKTNEDENPSSALMRSFAEEISAATEDNRQAVIEKWMFVPEIIAYAVVDRTIAVDDGAFHWYCSSGACSNHNYYWYEEPEKRKLHLIPWDMDNTFENIVFNQNPVTPIADDWGQTRANCQPFPFGSLNLRQKSAACDKLTAAWASFDTEYQELLSQFKAGPLSESVVNAKLDAWAAQIRAATEEAANAHSDALSISAWENAMENLKFGLSVARSR